MVILLDFCSNFLDFHVMFIIFHGRFISMSYVYMLTEIFPQINFFFDLLLFS